MLGQLGIILVGFADNIMVGQHSADELAAASFVNNFFNLAFIFGMGFAYGLTPIIGELFSKGAHDKAAETFKNSLLVNLVVGLLIGLCMLVLLLNIDLLGQPLFLAAQNVDHRQLQDPLPGLLQRRIKHLAHLVGQEPRGHRRRREPQQSDHQ